MNAITPISFIGQPMDRVDGPAKVTGQATYAADTRIDQPVLVGAIVEASVPAGRITAIDTSRAEAAEGVVFVMTHLNAPAQKPFGKGNDRFTQSHAVMDSDEVRYHGAPVALVIAHTLEQARHAAHLVDVAYDVERPILDPRKHRDKAFKPSSLDGQEKVDAKKGNFERTFRNTTHQLAVQYKTPSQHATAMEPHATLAHWSEDGKLTLHISLQILSSGVTAIANTLKMRESDIRILSPFIGGGFGSKLGIHNEAILAALAAKELKRPVRIAQHRRTLFSNGPHRPPHWQILQMAADESGHLKALAHDTLSIQSKGYPFAESAAAPSRATYAVEALRTTHRIVEANIPKADSMRAPGDAVGTLTLEAAIDELAEKCGIDPVDFRILNEPKRDPESDKPFSTHTLVHCLKEGAAKFGWTGRQTTPGLRREGNLLVGHGVATAIRANLLQQAGAEVSVNAEGLVTVRLDMTDIGTGTYTILTQIAAEALGADPRRVSVEMGDSDFPATSGSGGSFGAGSSGTAVHFTCNSLKDELLQRAAKLDDSWRGINSSEIAIHEGALHVGTRSMPIGALLKDADGGSIAVTGNIKPGNDHQNFKQFSYGAQFAEVAVDAFTGEIRLRRMLGVFDAGRILNAKTAHSQLMGGMIFGIGAALMEESLMDGRYGAFMNRDLAEYHISVNRDVPKLEIHMIDTPDMRSNPLGSKGIGELGICGAGPAVANAIYDATGFRARKFPIHLDDLLPFLPKLT